jgi:hypothetical protein
MDDRQKLATVLFDEAHSEAWTVRSDVAAAIQPAHPADSSLATAASALAEREFEVAVHTSGPLDADVLRSAAALVLAHPSDPKWEATVDRGSPRLADSEIDAILSFVERGGGLIVLGETEHDKYGNNLNDLLARFGIRIEHDTVQDYEHHFGEAPSWILARLERGTAPGSPDLLARVDAACFYRAGTLATANGAIVLARAHSTASAPGAPLAAVARHGAGRIAVLADSDLFGDDCIGELSHTPLWLNLVYWAAGPAFGAAEPRPASAAAADPAWAELKGAVEELRAMQAADGSIDRAGHDHDRAVELTAAIAGAVRALAPRFPHQRDYLVALEDDLRSWSGDGFPQPAFDRSLETFRPERERRDGIEHLCVFPMYKQNASPDTCLEALIVRVPWPAGIAELERSRYDNPKFVPVTFVDFTSGYDSECAVLFPETVATAERPAEYHFGAIFCDRESERFRRICGAAAELLAVNLPPDAACLLESAPLARDAYVLWDLVHDRTHMHGDLPFDPFMIRQRSPYWMYSLEELRCDLTAFGEAVELEAEGLAIGRHVQYAIVFDRLFRFPITGPRVRNYDGLGGQLLFAFLHREGYLHWTDNRLMIEWDRLAEGVGALRRRVDDLYHSGIDRSKLAQWLCAHDLVAAYVPPAESSVWAAEHRALPEVGEPRQLVDLVRDDEFPLSLFYAQLQARLGRVPAAP